MRSVALQRGMSVLVVDPSDHVARVGFTERLVDARRAEGTTAHRADPRGERARHTAIVANAIDSPDFVPRAEPRELLGIAPHVTVVGTMARGIEADLVRRTESA